MPDAFRITSMVPGLPERVYSAWLDSSAHAAFTGASAKIDPTIGGKFAVLDGTVQGRTVELLPGRRIVQTWRAKEFPHGSRDSRLEIQFEGVEGSTRVTIMHSLLPPGQGERQKQTWIARYFQPMRAYFGKLLGGLPVGVRGRPDAATVGYARPSTTPSADKKAAKPASIPSRSDVKSAQKKPISKPKAATARKTIVKPAKRPPAKPARPTKKKKAKGKR